MATATQCLNNCKWHSHLPKKQWRNKVTSKCRNAKADHYLHIAVGKSGCPYYNEKLQAE